MEAAELAVAGGADVILVPQEPKGFLYAWLKKAASDPALAAALKTAEERLDRVMKAAGSVGTPAPELVGCLRTWRPPRRWPKSAWRGAAPRRSPAEGRFLPGGRFEDPADWAGGPFLEELRALGDRRRALAPSRLRQALDRRLFRAPPGLLRADRLRGGSRRPPAQGPGGRAPGGAVVSFGNPFVLKSFPKSPGLCSFAGDALAQKAAARALAGRIPVTGRMPVRWT